MMSRITLVLSALLLTSPVAAERKLKPTVCLSWTLYRAESGSELVVCKDDKPWLVGSGTVVTLQGPNGAERVLVGYRGMP